MLTNFPYPLYLVGGAVRDKILGEKPKDLDFAVVHANFADVEKAVVDIGGKIYQSRPEFQVIRCRLPDVGDVDLALARKDGEYSDGRRPDSTEIASSIAEDLARRDLTINAMALDVHSGNLVDPFGGLKDLHDGVIKAVGDPAQRFSEDALRVFRLVRFAVRFGKEIDPTTFKAVKNVKDFSGVASERMNDELSKTLAIDPFATFQLMNLLPHLKEEVLRRGINFTTNLKKA